MKEPTYREVTDAAVTLATTYNAPTEAGCRLRQNLVHAHGAERAGAIIAGRDMAAARDLAAWRKLGEPDGS